ncbi:MAG: glycosyl hydrolase [Pirellulales bacterium]
MNAARSIGPVLLGLLFLGQARAEERPPVPEPLAWPAATAECRPWTRWWWLGSAVDKPNLTRLLAEYRRAGLGGVEICPIYGAKGAEDRFLDFLSPAWMDALAHTTTEAKRLGLGVDMTTGTGWPFGGPSVTAEDASSKVVLKRYDVPGGATLADKLPTGRLQCLVAVSKDAQEMDLTARVAAGRLDWTAPPGSWRLYAVVQAGPVQKVKRAAPGGQGNVLDPYSVAALDKYLAAFDRAFAAYRAPMPRAQFHDSFEYAQASWTSDFFREFQTHRGYDLRAQLPALFGEGPEETAARVRCDYRETVSDLHLAYIERWTAWSHAHGGLSRNQAHGAPANLLDLYAAADIPETEIFRGVDERQIPMLKFSSSAAHLTGRKLASSESFTWLGEHFQVPLSEVKPAADFLFLAGVNHLFFHGVPYSPADAPWPGWLFYASVNFGPEGGLWRDLPEFNAYVTRCQSVLQSGEPANDVLVYFPVHDIWQSRPGLLLPFTVHNQEQWLWTQPFHATAMALSNRGYGFDEVSDRLLADAHCEGGRVRLGGNAYRVVLVPACRLMPETTLKKLAQLARDGATILFQEHLPGDVPGLGNLEKRRAAFQETRGAIALSKDAGAAIRHAPLGRGAFVIGADLERMLAAAGVVRESAVDSGLQFIRRAHAEGHHYFFVNRGDRSIDGWITLGTPASSAVLLDTRFENRAGVAAVRHDAAGTAQVYLQLHAGESCVLRTFAARVVDGPAWRYFQSAGEPVAVTGTWQVRFVEGGPAIPSSFDTRKLASWTALGDAEAKRFAGTARYMLDFDRPAGMADDWVLDLGQVCESARIWVNGRTAGTLWCHPYRIAVGELLRPGHNTLKIEVTNLAANRIADLDRRKVPWKNFHEINFVNLDYKPFDASQWPPRDSGLLGPVQLAPVKHLVPAR